MSKRAIVPAALAALAAVGLAAAAPHTGAGAKPVPLAEATLIVEVNATDGDAGLQVFLDGEPWRSMTLTAPDGRKVLEVQGVGRLRNWGLTELFSESSEPAFDVFPLEKFKELFPQGTYSFAGTSIDGKPMTGRARLSHAIPDGPEIVAPKAGTLVRRGALVARWKPVVQPGIRIKGYRAIVSREDPLRVFSADLTAATTSIAVPPAFLERGVEYKLEVQAIERSGNQTLTEVPFRVG